MSSVDAPVPQVHCERRSSLLKLLGCFSGSLQESLEEASLDLPSRPLFVLVSGARSDFKVDDAVNQTLTELGLYAFYVVFLVSDSVCSPWGGLSEQQPSQACFLEASKKVSHLGDR